MLADHMLDSAREAPGVSFAFGTRLLDMLADLVLRLLDMLVDLVLRFLDVLADLVLRFLDVLTNLVLDSTRKAPGKHTARIAEIDG